MLYYFPITDGIFYLDLVLILNSFFVHITLQAIYSIMSKLSNILK